MINFYIFFFFYHTSKWILGRKINQLFRFFILSFFMLFKHCIIQVLYGLCQAVWFVVPSALFG